MKARNFILTVILIAFTCLAYAQEAINYVVKLDNVQHHEIEVTVEFASVPQGVFTIRMPNASPGRYAPHGFAKNVYNEKAFDSQGKELICHKSDVSEWQVAGHDGFVKFQYTLYGNHGDGTYAGIDNRKVMMNMPAAFVYGVGMEFRPIDLMFDLSQHKDWHLATQLKPLENKHFWAPNYYYFYDSPTIVGDVKFRDWQEESNGKTYNFEVAMLHEGTDEQLDNYVAWVKKVVEAEKAMYGALPDYDFGKYTFLCSYNPWVYGDGMEHRNSTLCVSRGNLADNANGLIGTIAHEFFHCWNVERIRPKSLEPFNFDKPNMSGELWFAEGFTSYYDDLMLCRAGILSPADYVEGLSGGLNAVINSPARKYRNVIQMSQHAPFVDAAVSIDENNYANTFISYYTYGAFLGLTLDLTIRNQFPNRSLDDVMRYMWERFGKTEIPYEIPDIQKAVADATGDAKFAADFFNRYIYDSYVPDPKPLLENMGVKTEMSNPGKLDFARLRMSFKDDGIEIQSPVVENNSLYVAGINRGDKILAIDNQIIKSMDDYNGIVEKLKIGKTYSIVFQQNGLMQTSKFTAKEDPSMSVSLDDKASSSAQRKRKDWLKN